MDIATFRKQFKELTAAEQDILKLLSVAYEPVKRSDLTGLLEELGTRRPNGSPIREIHLRDVQEQLFDGGWLVSSLLSSFELKNELMELVMRMAVIDPRFPKLVQMIRRTRPYRSWGRLPGGYELCLREMRISLYEGNPDKFREYLLDALQYYPDQYESTDFFGAFFTPFDADWLLTFPRPIQELAITSLLEKGIMELGATQPFLDFVSENQLLDHNGNSTMLYHSLALLAVMQGRFNDLSKLLETMPAGSDRSALEGLLAFLQKNLPLAVYHWEGNLKSAKKQNGTPTTPLPGLAGALLPLAVLKLKEKNFLKKAEKHCNHSADTLNGLPIKYVQAVISHQKNEAAEVQAHLSEQPRNALDWLFYALACYWTEQPLLPANIDMMKQLFAQAKANGYDWMAMELGSLLAKIENIHSIGRFSEETALRIGTLPLSGFVERTARWERALDALLNLQARRSRSNGHTEKETRLVWLVDFEANSLQPIEQSYGPGGWSKGRNVALKRLREGGVRNMTEQDRALAKTIRQETKNYYSGTDYFFDFEKAIASLVGHPLLFLAENREVAVELVQQEPHLLVEERDGLFELRFSQPIRSEGVQVVRETPTRYIALSVNEQHVAIDQLIGQGGLQVPADAKDKLIEVVGNLSTIVTVQSAVGGQAVEVQTVEASSTPYLHLLPVGEGFKLEFFVKPFSPEPPYFKPGEGHENVITEVGGVPQRAIRNLTLEKRQARQVVDNCPTLLRLPDVKRVWHFENTEDCLNVLLELEPMRTAGELVLEHPKGERLRITGQVNFDQLSIGIKKERDWFSLDGKVQVNEHLVMDFRKLLELTQKSDSRFVEVSDGQFLALTSQLRRKLDDLNAIFNPSKDALRFHPLAAPMLEDFTSMLHELEVDAAWQKQLTRLHEAKDIDPKVPLDFRAELRNYQVDGFRWLSQLAYWGVGACLADDMGLGKTVQALALILDRGNTGPALVVAPASVVRNWYHEAKRFAPKLRPLIFGEGDREEMLNDLQPYDLLLCSYGLMQQEAGRFLEEHFTTIVLDEAQAIKNRSTKRSQAAMQLNADFKIITTGTPIENHLGELWNLFNFLNPGLLGSIGRFNDNFAVPIERFADKERRNQLKRLIQPFILRRRKDDVLKELPAKTEVTLTVELSNEERAFYEALRRRAVERFDTSNGEAGEQRFQILAELMRLRQACCHPRLVEAGSQLPSSKLQLFAETVEELLDEGHKALVFSQFVKHLKLVEEWVKEQGIPYQYLDGSTSMAARDQAIRDFQGGEGKLFLISLKAGGFGLNLTAADYVIHMDPWWNPAVEDQASDRAHRIGQTRPVTIYRLVTENTIEEKIVKLHSEKRDLADSLLEGTERSARMNAEELLELMRG